ncbi:hypothetical protein [Deinococcus planocerae]|uniref:hypothetical protein n=1 Tax=Deinococcus planocerae TaxID=1737569 RepID=UPI0011AF8AC6|nr:hypothetical protein [Deinococcus planocerae]
MTWEEVVEWADGWILRLDAPPAELLELSLSGRRPDEAFTLLRRLARRGDPDAALSTLAGRLREDIDRGQADALVLAGRLTDLAALSSDEEPDDVRLPPPSPSFRDAAWLLYAISVERGTDDEEEEFDRNLAEEVLVTLQRFL